MKDQTILAQIPALKTSRQYYVAAWRRIEATINRDVPTALDEIRTDVGAILKEAMSKLCWSEANRILRNFKRFLHTKDHDEANLLINEQTIPENIEDLDLDAQALLL